jgi:hypothetical protein
MREGGREGANHQVAAITQVRALRHKDTLHLDQLAPMKVVDISAGAYAAFNATSFSAPKFLPAPAFVPLVRAFARKCARAFAPRRTAQAAARMIVAALVKVGVVCMEVVGVTAQLHAIEDVALRSAAQLVGVVARVLVGMLTVQHALGCAPLGAARFQARVLVSAVVKAVFL